MINYKSDLILLSLSPNSIKAAFKNQPPFFSLDTEITDPSRLEQLLPEVWNQITNQQDCHYDHLSCDLGLGEFWNIESMGIVAAHNAVVDEVDVYRVINAAKNVLARPNSEQVSWRLLGFDVDDVAIEHPVGQSGRRLSAKVNIIYTYSDYPKVIRDFCETYQISFAGNTRLAA